MSVTKKRLACFGVLIFWFVLFGPGIGTFVVSYWLNLELMKNGGVIIVLMFGYIVGIIPAMLAAIIDGFIIIFTKNSNEETTSFYSLLVGMFSGLFSGILCFFPLRFVEFNFDRIELLSYLSVFMIPGLVCGIFNKVAWRQINT